MLSSRKLTRSYFKSSSHGVEPLQFTPAELLDIRGSANPDKEALVVLDADEPKRRAITFGELKTQTENLAAGMIRQGLQTGDRVALLCPSSIEYAVVEYTLTRTGAILIRFHVSANASDSIKYVLKHGKCRWLIAHPGVKGENYRILTDMIPCLKKHDPSAARLAVDELPDLESIFIISSNGDSYPGTLPWTAFTKGIKDGDLSKMRERQAKIDGDMIHGCYCTSGSTGNPKFVAMPGHCATNFLRSYLLRWGLNENDRVMGDRPMCYAGGSTSFLLRLGATVYSVRTPTTGPEAKRRLDLYLNSVIGHYRSLHVPVHVR